MRRSPRTHEDFTNLNRYGRKLSHATQVKEFQRYGQLNTGRGPKRKTTSRKPKVLGPTTKTKDGPDRLPVDLALILAFAVVLLGCVAYGIFMGIQFVASLSPITVILGCLVLLSMWLFSLLLK